MTTPHFGTKLRQWLHGLSGSTRDDASDGELLERFVHQRDESAFAALVRRHGPLVLGVCGRTLSDEHDVEDVFQATFLVLACRAAAIRRRLSVASFLYGTALRIARHLRAHNARQGSLHRRVALQRPEVAMPAEDDTETHVLLHEELNRLSSKHRDLLILCYLQGKTNEQAAHELGYPPGSMSRHLSRARELLRKRLLARGVSAVLVAALAEQARATVPPVLLSETLATVRRHALASALLAGSSPSAAVMLAQGVLRAAWLTRGVLASLVLAIGVVLAGSVAALHTAVEIEPPAPAQASETRLQEVVPNRDLYGDPLPAGALARFGSEYLRHPYACGLAFAANGKMLITAGRDQMVRFWDCATGRLIQLRRVPRTHAVLALSPDGKMLALWGKEQLIIWDIAANKETQRIHTGTFEFNPYLGTLRFSPDGKTVAASNYGRAFRLWDIASGKERGHYEQDMGIIAFSPDSKILASCNVQRLALWDVAAGKTLRTIPGPDGKGGLPSFSPDGKLLAVDGAEAIALYETATGKEVAVWHLEPRRAEQFYGFAGAAVSPDGKIVAARHDDCVVLWDRTTGKVSRRLPEPHFGNAEAQAQLGFSPDGKQLVSLRTGSIVLWDVQTGKQVSERPSHFAAVDSAAFSPDGKFLASASGGEHAIRLWDAQTGKQLHVWPMPHSRIRPLIFTPDGTKLIAGGFFGDCRMWDVRSGEKRCIFRLLDVANRVGSEMIRAVHLSPDGKRLTALSLLRQNKDGVDKRGQYLTTWDVASGERVQLRALSFDAKSLPERETISSDGKLVVTIDPQGGFQKMIYDVVADRRLRKLPGRAPVAFSLDRKIIAYGGFYGGTPAPIQLMDVTTGGNVLSISAGDGWLRAFTPDSRYLVTTGEKDLRLWELATGKQVLHRRVSAIENTWPFPNNAFLSCLALAPDGRSAVTGFRDSNLLIWDLAPATRQKRKLRAADLDLLWSELAGEDAPKAYRAVGTLIADPEHAVPFLRDRLLPVKEDAPRIRRLIADLGSDQFPVRDAAFQELEKMDDAAHAVLRQELPKATSLEQRRRIQSLLSVPWLVQSPEKLRQIRAVTVLEQIGDAAALPVLQRLAEGATEARQTREAKVALQRLRVGKPKHQQK